MDKNDNLPFVESQRFTQRWLWASLLIFLFLHLAMIVRGFMVHDKEVWVVVILTLMYLGVLLLMRSIRLDTSLQKEGIYYSFFPFLNKKKHIPFDQIAHAEVVKYKPLSEYGGWGLRYGGQKRGWCYNIAGNWGLRIRLQNGRQLLIGTQQPEALSEALAAFMKRNSTRTTE